MATSNKQSKKQTRVKKNKKKYGQKTVIKDDRIHKGIFILLIISLLLNCIAVRHFATYNHNKVKKVTKIEKVIPENIVFLGDSLTYRYDLEKYFGNNHNIVNSGIDGNTTEDILDNMKSRVYNYNPSKVFILIGTNDIIKDKTSTEISTNIEKIIENIKENRPGCKIYLESLYPVNNGNDRKIRSNTVQSRTNETIEEINKTIKKYCQKNNITYIDLYNDLIDDDNNLKLDYTVEGLHLSDEGYEVITKKLTKYIDDEV